VTPALDTPVLLVAATVLVAGAAILLNGWRRTRAAGVAGARIDVVASRYLGSKRALTVIEVDGERLLLALSGSTVRLVTRLGRPAKNRSARPEGGPGAADDAPSSQTREVMQ
jgi:flagellar biogenesis protein FliO